MPPGEDEQRRTHEEHREQLGRRDVGETPVVDPQELDEEPYAPDPDEHDAGQITDSSPPR